MKTENCFELGYVSKPHGIAGEVQVNIESENPELYKELESVFVEINRKLIPFFIENINVTAKKAILKFEDVSSLDEATDLVGKKLFLPLDLLPELEEGQFYYHDIIDFQVLDDNKGVLGTVKEIVENPGNDLIIMEFQGNEVLIPITEKIVYKADYNNKQVLVNLPEGLLDLYLE